MQQRETHRSTDGATVVFVQRPEEAVCLTLELIPEEYPVCRQFIFQCLKDRVSLALELLPIRQFVSHRLLKTEKTQRGNTLKEGERARPRTSERARERERDREREERQSADLGVRGAVDLRGPRR